MIRSLLTRRTASAAAAVFAVALGGASVAWACSTQPNVQVDSGPDSSGQTSQTSGPSGSRITFSGRDFGPGPVQVRWNSRTGQLLGEAQGPAFSVPITIPNASVGVHYIVAFQTVGNSTASMAFRVTPSPTSSPSGSTGTTAAGDTGDEPTSSKPAQSSGDSAPATSASDDSTASSSTDSTGTRSSSASTGSDSTFSDPDRSQPAQVAANETTTPAAKASAPVATSATPATSVAAGQPRAASANPAVVTAPSGQAVFGGSSATPVAPSTAEAPSSATASGDTWSGFASDTKPSLLSDGLNTPSSAPNSASGVGIALLGAGVVALFAGFAAAESSRKRAVVATGGR